MTELAEPLEAKRTEDERAPAEGAAPIRSRPPLTAAAIVAISVVTIVGLSLWYLVQPQPLLIQGEADATRMDIAARVDGRVGRDRSRAATMLQLASSWSRSTIPSF